MKVNMTLLSGMDDEQTVVNTPVSNEKSSVMMDMDTDVEDEDADDEDAIDNSDKHSKVKTFLLIAAMVGGFGLCLWNMTGVVNNMRLNGQGYAVNITHEMEDPSAFMDYADGSASVDISTAGQTESGVTMDAARDGPGLVDTENIPQAGANETDEMAALRKETENALNEAALVKQELKNAEDMLDSSLQREAQLRSELNALSNSNP